MENNMPNWCENDLRIYGTYDDDDNETGIHLIKEITDLLESDKPTLLSYMKKMPKELEGTTKTSGTMTLTPDDGRNTKDEQVKTSAELIKLYGADNWYDWNIQNWGTKWDVHEPSIFIQDTNQIGLRFMTAWSPPIKIMNEFYNDNNEVLPEMILHYWEEGMGYTGHWQNGRHNEGNTQGIFDRRALMDTIMSEAKSK